MIHTKAKKVYGRYYPRKDRRVDELGLKYKTYFHYTNYRALKRVRKQANQKLRRYKGDVSDHGWYKRFDEVWWVVF